MDEGESKPESFDDDIIGWDEIQAETDGSDPAREWLRRCEIAYDTASGYMTGDAKESGSRIPVVTLRSLKVKRERLQIALVDYGFMKFVEPREK